MNFAEEKILVTGASSGLGRAFAKALYAANAHVVLAARREHVLAKLKDELGGRRVSVLPLDVTNVDEIRSQIRSYTESHGPITGLVNNSGVADTASLLDVQPETFDKVFATNLRGGFFVGQAVSQLLTEAGKSGAIVNVASTLGLKPLPGVAPYAMSKAGLIHMTKCMALEWARFGIRTNAICPGYIETDLNRKFFESEAGKALVKRFPRRRLGQTEHLTDLVAYLLSPAAELINGAVIAADDGFAIS